MADEKITALTELTTPALEDLLAIVDDPSGTPITKKVTLTNVKALFGSVVDTLGSTVTSSSVTMAKVTGLDQTLAAGTYTFEYHNVWQTTVAATAVKFGVNFSGTQTLFCVECTGFEATTAASTGANDQTHTAFGLRAGGQNRAPSTTTSIFGPVSADTVDSNMMCIIRGIIVVTVSGDLQLYFGSEATGSTQSLMAGSSLSILKTG